MIVLEYIAEWIEPDLDALDTSHIPLRVTSFGNAKKKKKKVSKNKHTDAKKKRKSKEKKKSDR